MDLQVDNKRVSSCLSRARHSRVEKRRSILSILYQQERPSPRQSRLPTLFSQRSHQKCQRQEGGFLRWQRGRSRRHYSVYRLQHRFSDASFGTSYDSPHAQLQVHLQCRRSNVGVRRLRSPSCRLGGGHRGDPVAIRREGVLGQVPTATQGRAT